MSIITSSLGDDRWSHFSFKPLTYLMYFLTEVLGIIFSRPKNNAKTVYEQSCQFTRMKLTIHTLATLSYHTFISSCSENKLTTETNTAKRQSSTEISIVNDH